MANDKSNTWPLTAIDDLWARLQLSERQSDILARRKSGEAFTEIAKAYGITPTAVRSEFILAESKETAIANWPGKHTSPKA